MSASLLFAHDMINPFKQPVPGSQLSFPSDDRLSTWLTQQSHPKTMSRAYPAMPQQECPAEDSGSPYTFTTQLSNELPQSPYTWNNNTSPMYLPSNLLSSGSPSGGVPNTDLLHSNPYLPDEWSQNYSSGSSDGPLASSSYASSEFERATHIGAPLSSYGSHMQTASLTTPTTVSDPSLSPLSGYSDSPHLPTPTTPMSPPAKIKQDPTPPYEGSGLLILGKEQASTLDPDRQQYTHKEQLGLFRQALSVPFEGAGPFVPQHMYKPHTTSDRKRYVEEVLLEAPIYFQQADNPNNFGISLKDALHSRTKKLLNRDQPVFEGRGPSVSIRLEWPGYRQWSRQIPTKDFRSPPGPITLAKLAKNIAKCVQRFMQDRKSLPMEDESDALWRVGDGPNDIKLDDLVLVSIHHVSLGSWQPQLRLIRPRPQRFGVGSSSSRQGQAQLGHTHINNAASMTPTNGTMVPLTPISATHGFQMSSINMRSPAHSISQPYHSQMLPHH